MSTETIDSLWALAVVLIAGAASIGVGLAVAHLLLDEYGRMKRWRRGI